MTGDLAIAKKGKLAGLYVQYIERISIFNRHWAV